MAVGSVAHIQPTVSDFGVHNHQVASPLYAAHAVDDQLLTTEAPAILGEGVTAGHAR